MSASEVAKLRAAIAAAEGAPAPPPPPVAQIISALERAQRLGSGADDLRAKIAQAEGQSDGGALREEGRSDGVALREEGRRDAGALREEGRSDGVRLREEGRSDGVDLREEGRSDGIPLREEGRSDGGALREKGRSDGGALREKGRSDGGALREKGRSDGVALREAAKLLESDALAGRSGLAQALEQLTDKVHDPPRDVTTWLCAKLRELRPREARVYERPVLDGLVLKCDEFAHIHLFSSPRIHPEVWNFRKCDLDMPVFGVGQCHRKGIAHIVNGLVEEDGFASIVWCNMREEPVVFLDGQACAPRTQGNLNENVEYLQSIEDFELDAMERRLCKDCEEAGPSLPVYYQTSGTENEKRNLSTTSPSCVADVYKELDVTYNRIPIADEAAPEEKDFDQLVTAIRGAPAKTAFVFNCQMGRGRTTTGMVAACIMWKAGRGEACEPLQGRKGVDTRMVGDFKAVRELVAMLEQGKEAKALCDACCAACAHAQHLVEAILACEASAAVALASSFRSAGFWRARGRNYLERYCYLVLFAAYALEHAPSFETSFSEWAHSRWQLKRVLKHMTLEG